MRFRRAQPKSSTTDPDEKSSGDNATNASGEADGHDEDGQDHADSEGQDRLEKDAHGHKELRFSKDQKGEMEEGRKYEFKLPFDVRWIQSNWSWSKWKPAIRSAIANWISLILVVIPATEKLIGQASFLILVAGFMSPPSDPFVAVLEREILIMASVTLAWAWLCLAAKLASLARVSVDPSVSPATVFTGQYIEAAPTVIMAVFLFLGSSFFLYVKARQGPGPFIFGTILGCICLDLSFTTANFFPYPYYAIGQAIVVPIAFHSAISLVVSLLVFPSTVSAQYRERLSGVLSPLVTVISEHRKLLQTCTTDPEFSASAITAAVGKSEAGLIPLAASGRLMKRDVVWCRFSPTDLVDLQNWVRRLSVRANGLGIYFTLIDPLRERFPVTPAASRPGTPARGTPSQSRAQSRAASRDREGSDNGSLPVSPATEVTHLESEGGEDTTRVHISTPHRRRSHVVNDQSHSHHLPRHSHRTRSPHRHRLHLPHLTHLTPQPEQAVGVFESMRYLDIEAAHLSHPLAAHYTQRATELLRESCDDLLGSCEKAIHDACGWLGTMNKSRFKFWQKDGEREKRMKEREEGMEKVAEELRGTLGTFMHEKRHLVLEPYRSSLDPRLVASLQEIPPHRHLFHCYVYQYHLMRVAQLVLEMLDDMIKKEKERKRARVWFPTVPLSRLWSWNNWEVAENVEHDDDENPDVIQGMAPEWVEDLGEPSRRDPDALPPRNVFEMISCRLYGLAAGLGHGNALFALKAGLFTVVLSLPSFLSSSATFAYENRFVWGVFMGQLTLARFRGDTSFGLVSRILSTFLGGVVGITIWYISTGSGRGNAFGLAAVCAVCFPFFYFARIYWPGPPMTNIIFFVTVALVVGYSWQDTHLASPVNPGFGYSLAWKRFVLVTAGVTAAFLASFLPPSTTLRRYQRRTFATSVNEIGAIYCSIISFANTPKDARGEAEQQEIIRSLIAIRAKLKRSIGLRENIIYEFSMRGRWPLERYHTILELQLQISYLLSHLFSVIEQLEPSWTRAFLRRTRFIDPDFVGDVLAVISLISTALRMGNPLPQITPCPLLGRFMAHQDGLHIVEEDGDYGLPRTLNIDTLENEQYMFFCVAVSTSYGIVTRLDRLMVATKELVGEQYHIHGVGFEMRFGEAESGTRPSSIRPARDA
ncbi:hypothetical protein JAAARDRAFT_39659 [Jaapia argillacea MUCL 33604]|uniref:ER transporter 6TM N-terminal domain-containing protein n=1 Tax=Jaapia argillacea MUCL 33604 TaxID=933084 RepID=A0A067PNR9_9AGAM|nr:hypothetical protein JAAARDRAFT_39659 [Jaapia argillacea MUCL 33604]